MICEWIWGKNWFEECSMGLDCYGKALDCLCTCYLDLIVPTFIVLLIWFIAFNKIQKERRRGNDGNLLEL